MSETSSHPRRVLHLVIGGFPPERMAEIAAPAPDVIVEVHHLTPANTREALEKIFAADTVAVWAPLI
jgi:hypothetical protein